jgi:hypothetical protein
MEGEMNHNNGISKPSGKPVFECVNVRRHEMWRCRGRLHDERSQKCQESMPIAEWRRHFTMSTSTGGVSPATARVA